jgi:hypothetical protein
MGRSKRGKQFIHGFIHTMYYAPWGEDLDHPFVGRVSLMLGTFRDNPNIKPNFHHMSLINSWLHQYYITHNLNREGINIMPKNTNNYGGYSFVSWRPTSEHKQFINHELSNGYDVLTALEDTVAQGYKLSLSYHVDSDSYIASLSCREPSDDNYKRVLSMWHSDGQKAIGALLVAHNQILGTMWPTDEQRGNEHDW